MIRPSINIMPEVPVPRIVELARHAERLGFARCWVYDEGLAARDVYVTLTAIAGATERIKIGPGITNPFTRHPGVTAAAIATLDEYSGGRAFLGIGTGGSLTLDPLAIEHRYALSAVREAIEALRPLLAGNVVDYAGRYFGLSRAHLDYARPDTAIWLAGRGPKMLALGGGVADGVMLEFIHRSLLDREFGRVRTAGAATGRRPLISYSTMIVTNESTMASTKPHMTYRLLDSPAVVQEMMGIGAAEVEMIRAAMPGGIHEAGRLIRDEWVTPFVIAGTIEQCTAQLRALDDGGVDEFLLPILQEEGAIELMDTLAAIMEAL